MLGPRRTSTLRLNISQTFTPIGNLLGVILGKPCFRRSDQRPAGADRPPLL